MNREQLAPEVARPCQINATEPQTVYRGLRRVDQHFKLTMVANNLSRMAQMLFAVPQGAQQ